MERAEHAQHVAEMLAPLMKPAAANRTLIDAARAYRDAIDAAHEDEHCAIQCNGVDESSGLEIEKGSRFHEDLIATVERTRSALDYVLSATGEVADGRQEAIKSKLEQGTGHAFGTSDTTCTGCGHRLGEHEFSSVEDMTYLGPSVTVETHITCNECDDLL